MLERYLCRVSEDCAFDHAKQVTRGACSGSSGLSPKGYLATIANQHSVNGICLIEARNELTGEADQFVVNGRLVSAMTGMLNVLDCIAAYCQNFHTDDGHTGFCYFMGNGPDRYPFRQLQFEFIQVVRRDIEQFVYDNNNFYTLANDCKHKVPWWGVPGKDSDGFCDIRDSMNFALLRDMAAPVYRKINHILMKLGELCGLSTIMFPTV